MNNGLLGIGVVFVFVSFLMLIAVYVCLRRAGSWTWTAVFFMAFCLTLATGAYLINQAANESSA